jgi:hypothetical protein
MLEIQSNPAARIPFQNSHHRLPDFLAIMPVDWGSVVD